MQHLAVPAFIENVAVAVGADHRAGMDPHAVAEDRSRIKDHLGEQANVFPEASLAGEVVSAHEHGARADPHALADQAMRPDVRRGINLRRGDDPRGGINARGERLRRKERREQPRQRHAGIGDAGSAPGSSK